MQRQIGRAHPKPTRDRPKSGLEIDSLGAQALAFIATDPDHLGDFLALTGLSAVNVRDAAADPGFSRGVLAYLAANEDLFIAFAAAMKLDPSSLGAAIQNADGLDAENGAWPKP